VNQAITTQPIKCQTVATVPHEGGMTSQPHHCHAVSEPSGFVMELCKVAVLLSPCMTGCRNAGMSEWSADLVLAASGRVENKESSCRTRHTILPLLAGTIKLRSILRRTLKGSVLMSAPHNAFIQHHIPRCLYGQSLPSYQTVQ
jgi:hypothetical protein